MQNKIKTKKEVFNLISDNLHLCSSIKKYFRLEINEHKYLNKLMLKLAYLEIYIEYNVFESHLGKIEFFYDQLFNLNNELKRISLSNSFYYPQTRLSIKFDGDIYGRNR